MTKGWLNLPSSGSDCISLVVLENYEPKLSYVLAELFNVFFNGILFLMLLESLICGLYLRMCRGLWLNAFVLLVSFLFLIKCFEKKAGQKIKFLSVYLSLSPSVYLTVCWFVYPSNHLSVRPSVTCHISGTVDNMIIIFGTHV